jgi:hypothetical protein
MSSRPTAAERQLICVTDVQHVKQPHCQLRFVVATTPTAAAVSPLLPPPPLPLLQVLDAAACADLGMGCFLGVAEASMEPPAFIHLTYKPSGDVKKKVCGGGGWGVGGGEMAV